MQKILQDLRFALRQLRRSPGFAITAILTLALGIGANSAIFSLLDQALLRSLPVRDPKSLVILEGTGKAWEGHATSHGGDSEAYFSYPMYRDLQARSEVFDGLVATSPDALGLTRRGMPEAVDGEYVSGNYFAVLGVSAAKGRLLVPGDDAPGSNHQVAVLSYAYWREKCGADESAIGETVRLNGVPVEIVGVAAPGFQSAVWGQTPSLFLPMSSVPELTPARAHVLTDHRDKWLNIVGRLRDGMTIPQAESQLAPLWHALRADELKALGTKSPRFVASFLTDSRMLVLPGARGLSYRRDELKTPMLVVMGMAVLVLLIAAVNVASLLLVRSSGRVREFAVRYALGATARRVLLQLLLEGLLLGIAGALGGVALAPLAMRTIAQHMVDPGDATFFLAAADARLLVFSIALAMLVSVVFSAAPALQLLKPDLVASLKRQGETTGGGRSVLRRAVVGLQIGLSVVLLVGASMFVRTLRNLRHADVGFNTSHLLTFTTQPQMAGISREMTPALFQQILARLSTLPGVTGVGATDSPELAGSDKGTNVSVQGYVAPPDEDMDVLYSAVSDGYLATMQMPLVAGREFTSTDDTSHPLVAIVNESFAKHYFGSPGAAIGRRMARGSGDRVDWREIVGVMRDSRHSGPRSQPQPAFFMPLRQSPKSSQLSVYLRTVAPPLRTAAAVRTAMHEIDPGIALINLRDMDEQIDADLSNERMIELLAVSFSVLATGLAGIGLYGVLAFSVAQRTREIGVRMALGSTPGRVAYLIVKDVMRLAGIGIVAALPVALLSARSLRSQLYGVSAMDPASMLFAVALIAVVAALAAVLPAWRAATVQPNQALRTE